MSKPVLVARIEGTLVYTALFKSAGSAWTCLDSEKLAPGEKSKHPDHTTILLLGEDERSLRHFVLPQSAPANIRRMALLQARQRLPDSQAQYLLDVLTEKSGTQVAALTVAIRRTLAEAAAQRLLEAGLTLDGIAIEPLCYAVLAPAKGRTRLTVGHWFVACRDGLPVGWRTYPDDRPVEEYFCHEPREFKADQELDDGKLAGKFGVKAIQLPMLAAAISATAPKQPHFQEFLDRESLAPAQGMAKLGLFAVWAAGLLLTIGGFYAMLLREEARHQMLKEVAAQRSEYSKLSQRVAKDLGQTTQLVTELRTQTTEKTLAVSPLRALSDILPAGVRLTALSYTADGQMLMDGEATEPRLPVLLLDLLRSAPGFSPPVLEFVSDRGADKFQFRISCKPHNSEAPAATTSPGTSAPKGEIEL